MFLPLKNERLSWLCFFWFFLTNNHFSLLLFSVYFENYEMIETWVLHRLWYLKETFSLITAVNGVNAHFMTHAHSKISVHLFYAPHIYIHANWKCLILILRLILCFIVSNWHNSITIINNNVAVDDKKSIHVCYPTIL